MNLFQVLLIYFYVYECLYAFIPEEAIRFYYRWLMGDSPLCAVNTVG